MGWMVEKDEAQESQTFSRSPQHWFRLAQTRLKGAGTTGGEEQQQQIGEGPEK